LVVTVAGSEGPGRFDVATSLQPHSTALYGEFHKSNREALLTLGQRVDEATIPERVVKATFVLENVNGLRFAFNPPRKWEYRTKIRKGDAHVFTISCIVKGVIVGVFTSTLFKIVPILNMGAKVEEHEGEEVDDQAEDDEQDSPILPSQHRVLSKPAASSSSLLSLGGTEGTEGRGTVAII
jgi:hypothetical protein